MKSAQEFTFIEEIAPRMHVKIGAPPYLNSKPLIYGLEKEVQQVVPSRLVALFQKKQLQVVLAPIVEFFQNERALLLPDMAIASRGAVASVKLVYRTDFQKIKKVAIDSSSCTSELLLALIFKEKYQMQPEYTRSSVKIDFENSVFDAMLVIGDPAFEFSKYPFIDLGEAWFEMTGTPFVYAAWLVDQDCDQIHSIYKNLLNARQAGLKNIEKIIYQSSSLLPHQARYYLTENIVYSLGPEEWKGIQLFQKMLQKTGLIPSQRHLQFAAV